MYGDDRERTTERHAKWEKSEKERGEWRVMSETEEKGKKTRKSDGEMKQWETNAKEWRRK
jgi:hypothetical protein